MAEPLSKDTFETWHREHQKYLDSKFDKLAGCINGVKKSVEDVDQARAKAWLSHAEECSACRDCQDKKFKKLQKALIIGCVLAALLGAALAPSLGWTHVAGFLGKLFLGAVPAGI